MCKLPLLELVVALDILGSWLTLIGDGQIEVIFLVSLIVSAVEGRVLHDKSDSSSLFPMVYICLVQVF